MFLYANAYKEHGYRGQIHTSLNPLPPEILHEKLFPDILYIIEKYQYPTEHSLHETCTFWQRISIDRKRIPGVYTMPLYWKDNVYPYISGLEEI